MQRTYSLVSCTPDLPTVGYSSYCVRGEHKTCAVVGADCECPNHDPATRRGSPNREGDAVEPPDIDDPTDDQVLEPRQTWQCTERGCEDVPLFLTGQALGAHRRIHHPGAIAPTKIRAKANGRRSDVVAGPGPVTHWVLAVPHLGDVKMLVVTDFERMQDLNGYLKCLGHAVYVLEVRGGG